MKLYLAAVYTSSFGFTGAAYARLTENEKRLRRSARYILESYHYIHKPTFVEKIRKDGAQVFLDSGAFSAYTKGINVDIDAYCRYIQEHQDIIAKDEGTLCASVLDGIGDPLLTWQHQRYMEKQGVQPLPCFHFGEDERYLEWYIQNYDYITLGGMVGHSKRDLIVWLDRIWDRYLTNGSGRPCIRVHGFGLTSGILVARYPWHSVDSSAWVQSAQNGSIVLLPEGRNIAVSQQSPSRKVEGQHYATLTEPEKKKIREKLMTHGIDLERLQETYLARWAYNMYAYDYLGDLWSYEDPVFRVKQPELF